MASEPPSGGLGGVFCLTCGTVNAESLRVCSGCGSEIARRGARPSARARGETARRPASPEYMGFWIRAMAFVVDGLVLAVLVSVVSGLLNFRPGLARLVEWSSPLLYLAAAVALRSETPGKKMLGLRVVDAQGNAPGFWATVMRELVGKSISAIFIGLGFLWMGWNGRKRGWHDYMAGTCVVRKRPQEGSR